MVKAGWLKQELHTAVVDLYFILEHERLLLKQDQENGFSLVLPSACALVGHSTPPQQSCRLAVQSQVSSADIVLKMNSVR